VTAGSNTRVNFGGADQSKSSVERSGTIAFVDTESGELQECRLLHRGEAEKFYRDLATQGTKVRGMGPGDIRGWLERLLGGLQFELWVGDATEKSRSIFQPY
jgi:hypothetical protein